ncbi:hypothetical protein M5K25_026486 [Dendrobium thyrsiflorum]|uniref:Uncharacterized protein n=1 Tax=Dendrobium thyrsiflorum TaxID=117978 RepID=A0ABD0TXU0_DENTH
MHRMGAIKSAIGDAVITFLWVFCVSTIGALTSIISSALQVQGFAPNLLIITFLIAVLVFFFNLIAHALGGASFNPTGIAAFYAAGIGGDSLISLAVRFPSQAAGAVGGVLAIVEFMPSQYKHMLGGPSVKVDLHTAAIAEGLLTFLISFAVLWIVIKGPRSMVVKSLMVAVTTVTLVVSGSGYTGPAMNPANVFSNSTWYQSNCCKAKTAIFSSTLALGSALASSELLKKSLPGGGGRCSYANDFHVNISKSSSKLKFRIRRFSNSSFEDTQTIGSLATSSHGLVVVISRQVAFLDILELNGSSSSLTLVTAPTRAIGLLAMARLPLEAFGWAFIKNRHNTLEQFYVYWICPFIGAISAAWFFRILFPPPSPKTTKAKKA